MKAILLFFMALVFSTQLFAQKAEQYSRVKVIFDRDHDVKRLSGLGVAVDHGESRKGVFFTSDFSASELQRIKDEGFKTEIIYADVTKHYQEQNNTASMVQKKSTSASCDTTQNPIIDVPTHFHLGSYAGYYTYDELLAIIDSMHLLYPNIISARLPIDTFLSIQGRPIYWMRVSNNPSVSQPTKPQMLTTALHHAREPESISATIFYMWYLLEHYGTDSQVTKIVDNTELYFIPCVNPDGYIYNITSNPAGGGMWRKNLRDNGDGTLGVDINRNYGYFWGYDNIGSSDVTSNETYRGTSGFSEPETKAVRWMEENHHIQIAINYHTYGNDLIYPWGYQASFKTPDSSLFDAIGGLLTRFTPYTYGTGDQTVGYVTNGDSDDYGYGEQTTKNKVFSMTPEIGDPAEGFYPPASTIIPNAKNVLLTNVNAAALLLPYGTIQSNESNIITHASGYFHYQFQRVGLPDIGTYTVSMVPLDSWLTLSPTPNVYVNPVLLDKLNDSVSYTINASTPNGQLVRYALKLYNGYYTLTDTVQFYYGTSTVVITPTTNALTGWTTSSWGVSNTIYYSAPSSITDSPFGDYSNNGDVTITLDTTIDLTYSIKAYLDFYARWEVEKGYDYAMVMATPAGTQNWQPLCGLYTKAGNANQLIDEPIYDGHQVNWVHEHSDLNDYLGQKINIRFELKSDQFQTYDGFYFDNFKAVSIQDSTLAIANTASAKPTLTVSPNPATSELTITTTNMQSPLTATLCDGTGRTIQTILLNKPKTTTNLSQLPAGIYYLKVNGAGYSLPVQKVSVCR